MDSGGPGGEGVGQAGTKSDESDTTDGLLNSPNTTQQTGNLLHDSCQDSDEDQRDHKGGVSRAKEPGVE